LSETIWYDAEAKKLYVSGAAPLTPREAADLQALVNVVKTDDGQYVMKGPDGEPVILGPDGERLMRDANGLPARIDADGLPDPEQPVSDWRYQPADRAEREFFVRLDSLLTQISRQLGYRQRLAGLLRGNAQLSGVWWREETEGERATTVMADGEWDPAEGPLLQFGEIQEYRDTVAQYEEAVRNSEMTGLAHYREHADRLKTKLQTLRGQVVGQVVALDAEFRERVFNLLDENQLRKKPLPPESTPGHRASVQVMWGLLILGPLLILGLLSRVAAFAGAMLVLSFYLVIPPWPGVPPELQAPEHALYINKNLIEVLALLGLAAVPSGTWFGLDGLIGRLWRSRQAETNPVADAPSPVTTPPIKSPPQPDAVPETRSPPSTKRK
jgi:uncharacterized membrane protein YphA (DoxX/SURF4 family)